MKIASTINFLIPLELTATAVATDESIQMKIYDSGLTLLHSLPISITLHAQRACYW